MANSQGFIVLPNAVSERLVQNLASELDANISNAVPTARLEKYNEYQVSPLGYAVKDDFIKNSDKSQFASLFHLNAVPQHPASTNIGVFHETKADPSKLKTANEEEVYVTIAVTDLGQHNGWFTFYEGSHLRKPPLRRQTSVMLKAGDAVAWSGALIYFHNSGGGGKFITLVYPNTW